jgi:HD-GYP domain-containing protein (c-di-GMP phosphodiesterase class II)
MESSQGSRFDSNVPSRMPQSPGLHTGRGSKYPDAAGARSTLFTRLLNAGPQGAIRPGFYSIPNYWICEGRRLPFGMYRKTITGEVIRICESNRIYLPMDALPITDEEPGVVLVKKESRLDLLHYLDRNLDDIVANPQMSVSERAELFYYLGYRRLRAVYRNPNRITLGGVKGLIALMVEQILLERETVKQVFELVQDNVCRTTDHPESSILHSLNVGILSTFFVMKVLGNLSRDTLEDVALGYFLHNIGMMRLPQKIMDYGGELGDATWTIIRQHPVWGLEMVKGIEEPSREAAHIIMDHHEKLNGKGYPRALTGVDIHFFVKVCSLLDAFNAMISDRSYRQAMQVVEALKAIKQKVPLEYDPGIFSKLILVFLDNELI